MNNKIPDLISKKLELELPGTAAHGRMMSYGRKSAREVRAEGLQPRIGAVLMLLYPDRGQWHTVLIERPKYEGTHSGQIAFPGGKQEDSDKDLVETALRETEEEVGVSPSMVNVLGELTELYIPPSNFLVQPILGFASEKPNFVADPREVEVILETPVEEFFIPGNKKEKDIFLPNYNMSIKAPYFDVHQRTVWGATAMMIQEFIELGADLDW